MTLLTQNLLEYAQAHSEAEPSVLSALYRQTHLETLLPQMLSGPVQGRFLAMMSRLLQPRYILEVGTFTGYSCICLAEGLAEGGKLITLEVDPEREEMIRDYLKKTHLTDRVELKIGPALALIGDLAGPFDLVFIDADKENYLAYYQQLLPLTRPGGLIIADNALWDGKVLDQEVQDAETCAIRAFNEFVQKMIE